MQAGAGFLAALKWSERGMSAGLAGAKAGATAAQQELRPVPDIHKALHAMLSGDSEAVSLWLPQPTKQECSCVSRSVDVAAFYRDISFVSGLQSSS